MDARAQDSRASAGTGSQTGSSGSGNRAAKSIGFAELLATALGLGGLYLLVRLRSEATSAERGELGELRPGDPVTSHPASVAGWGHTYPHPENPPAWVHDEHVWEHAKQTVRSHWHEYREPWAVVAHVYEQMGGRTD